MPHTSRPNGPKANSRGRKPPVRITKQQSPNGATATGAVGYALLLLLALLTATPGCSSSSKPAADKAADATDGAKEGADDKPLEPYDAPPLADVDAKAEWEDQRLGDAIEIRRAMLKEHPPMLPAAEALALRNDSAENNEKIYSVLRQLPAKESDVDYDATFVHHVGGDAKSLNPLMKNSVTEFELLLLTGMNLIEFDYEFKPFAPTWAIKSWQVSKDRMMDKFVLRDDLTWSDGKPLTAHDVVFTFKTIMDPRVPIWSLRTQVKNLRWIEAYDDHTLVIFHKEPMASWTENIYFPIIPKHVLEKSVEADPTMAESDEHVAFERQPVTCGPYEYVKRVQGQETIVRRRDAWHTKDGKQIRPKPYVKEFRFRVLTDPNTALLAVKAGDVDEIILNPEQWTTQSGGDDFYKLNTKIRGDEWTEFHIEWNNASPFFSDKRVRQAMAYAFNADEMRKAIFYDLVRPGTGIFHPDAWMASKNIKPYQQDLEKAEQLLDEAGWTDEDGDGVREKEIGGRSVKFEFTLVTYEQPQARKACELLKDNLDQIGIVCNVKPTEFTVKSQLAKDHKFDAMMGGWGTGTDPSTSSNMYKTGEERNFGSYSNPEVDKLYDQGQLEFDREKRAAIYAKIHELMWEDQPSLWLFHRYSNYAVNKRVRGVNFSPQDPWIGQPGLLGVWIPKK